jgi:hypothetical protein
MRKSAGSRSDQLIGMIVLEMIGCYAPWDRAQRLSFGGKFLPRRGDFLALVCGRTSMFVLLPTNQNALA